MSEARSDEYTCPIWILRGDAPDWSEYIEELLRLAGLVSVRVASEAAWETALERPIVLVMGDSGTGWNAGTEAMEEWVQAGGWLVLFAPQEERATLAGLKEGEIEPGPLRLRALSLWSQPPAGATLGVPGTARRYELQDGRVLARLICTARREEFPGIVERPMGKGGVLTFCYALPECIARLRQGNPKLVELYRQHTEVPRVMHLVEGEADVEANWRPQADLHARLLADFLEDRINRHYPLPRLWHLPNEAKTLVIFSGDEDGASFEQTRNELHWVERYGGTATIYCMSGSGLVPAEREEIEAAGHTLSAHPNCWQRHKDEGIEASLELAEQELTAIQSRLWGKVRTVRNHRVFWPEYLDLATFWEAHGVRMDLNAVTSYSYWIWDWAPYMTGSGLPLRFCHLDGRRIHVYQQPTHFEDDVQLGPTGPYSYQWPTDLALAIMMRMVRESEEWYHEAVCLNIHPTNFARFSGDWTKAFLEGMAAQQIPIWSPDRWLTFWEAREGIAVADLAWEKNALSFQVHIAVPHPALRLMLPMHFDDRAMHLVEHEGQRMQGVQVEVHGKRWYFVALPGQPGRYPIRVQYE